MREKVLQLAVSTMVFKIKVTCTEYNQCECDEALQRKCPG